MSKSKPDSKKAPSAPTGGVYQKFLEFLKSPMWVLPVMSFVEQRSVVFDKEQGDQQLYEKIHNEFRSMVDMLIQCFCDDMGVKPQQVADALKTEKAGEHKTNVEWSLLEPVIAANDFTLFVHMMMRKNIELQLQAVQMIEIMCGLIPAVLLPGGPDDMSPMLKNADEQEKIILIQVMRQSKDDFEKQKAKNESKNKELDDTMKASLAEKDRLVEAQRHEEQLVQEALKLSMVEKSPEPQVTKAEQSRATASRKSVADLQPPGTKDLRSNKDLPSLKTRAMSVGASAIEAQTIRAKKSNPDSGNQPAVPDTTAATDSQPEKISDEELRKRQDYLRQQRDKLLAMKREAREVAFEKVENDGKQTRPKTARAAKAALRGGLKGDLAPVSNDVLAARRALAEKLKQEVVRN